MLAVLIWEKLKETRYTAASNYWNSLLKGGWMLAPLHGRRGFGSAAQAQPSLTAPSRKLARGPQRRTRHYLLRQ